MKHFYCSAFSGLYCYQGLVLYNSIKKTDPLFTIYYVCLDDMAYEIFSKLKLEDLVIIKIEQLEKYFPELEQIKANRSINEYAWTIKSCEMLYILYNYKHVDRIIWFDGDTQMLSNPKEIYDEWAAHPILLTEQYYTDSHESLTNTFGRFQAGLVGFTRDAEGLACLKWWCQKCIDWCYNKFEEGRWADQKYLDDIPKLYKDVCIVKSLGINMTPFILYRLNFEQQKFIKLIDGELYVNDIKIVFFHFYGFRYFDDNTFDLCSYWMKFTKSTVNYLYIPYIEACRSAIMEIAAIKADYKNIVEKQAKRITCYFNLKRSKCNAAYDFATILSIDRLQEGLALYYSMLQNCKSFYWWICCTDAASYDIINGLNLSNASAIFVDSILDRVQRKRINEIPEHYSIEKLKACFLHFLLKNNFAINEVVYIGSCYYILGDLNILFEEAEKYGAFIISQERYRKEKKDENLDSEIIGLMNSKEISELLQYGIDKYKGVFNLANLIMKHLGGCRISGVEYNCTLENLIYSKPRIKQDGIYFNERPLRIFSFNDNERLADGSVQVNKKAKLYLSKDLYSQVFERYSRDLEIARYDIYRIKKDFAVIYQEAKKWTRNKDNLRKLKY